MTTYIGIVEVARRLGVSRQYAWQLARRLRLGTATVRGWRYTAADVAAIQAARRPPGRPRKMA